MGTTRPCALLVVEREFLTTHIGVRRVILHYWRALEDSGHDVALATPDGRGGLLMGEGRRLHGEVAQSVGVPRPRWTSAAGALRAGRAEEPQSAPASVSWTDAAARPGAYDVVLVTNPWLCSAGLPPMQHAVGIVYDMVPNLLSIGALTMPCFIDAYAFARAHDIGYRYMLANAERILCISEATRSDFLRFFPGAVSRTVVDIPFDAQPGACSHENGRARSVLLVNALDPRKNVAGIGKALALLSRRTEFRLRVAGPPRMPMGDVLAFLGSIADLGVDVAWYGAVPDAGLNALYRSESVLLFPSFYEGLGLPILEAQVEGMPVISSNTSSCPEINLNPDLCVPPRSPEQIAQALEAVLDGTTPVLRGDALQQALMGFLQTRSRKADALAL